MPHGMSSRGRAREPNVDPLKPVYRGKTPLKTSDIVYIEQAPGLLDIHQTHIYPYISDNPPPPAYPNAHGDLLDKFPNPPGPPPRPARNPSRTTSMNSHSSTAKIPSQTYITTGQSIAGREPTVHRSPSMASFSRPTVAAYPSLAAKQQRREATAAQAMGDILNTSHHNAPILGSSRQAARVRAKSHGTTPRPAISRSTHSSRANLRHVPSQISIPRTAAADHGQPYWPHSNYRDFLNEQDPHTVRNMINSYPVAPYYDKRLPRHLHPLRFDMNDQQQFAKTISYWIHLAVAQGLPLDARADGAYHRIVEAGDPSGIVPQVGSDWSQQGEYR
jgi:hypothetical protein